MAGTARQEPLPHFEKAFAEIEIVTPKGSNNAPVWDTSNRAIQVVLNNLKGIFFQDDDMEHKYSSEKIRLPVTDDGTPDFLFMESYMKALPYGNRI